MSSNFLWAPGTSNSGLLSSLLTLQNTELDGLTTGSLIVSSVGGSSGKFTNSDTGQAVWGDLYLTLGAIGSALSSGAALSGWFLTSPDSGTTYESTTLAPPRSPDFTIPLPATTISAGTVFKSQGKVLLPALQFKVIVQNNTGQTFAGSAANFLKLATQALQY
jgi:hypothetical protein